MKISKATAESALAGTVPADMDEYTRVCDYITADAPDGVSQLARMGVFIVLGQRLAKRNKPQPDDRHALVDVSEWRASVYPAEAFAALSVPKKVEGRESGAVPVSNPGLRRPPTSGRDLAGNQGERDDDEPTNPRVAIVPGLHLQDVLKPDHVETHEPITANFQEIARHAREQPQVSDCANRATPREAECAAHGCGFCTAAQRAAQASMDAVRVEVAPKVRDYFESVSDEDKYKPAFGQLPLGRVAPHEVVENSDGTLEAKRLDTATPRVASEADLARHGLLRSPAGDFYPPHTPGAYPARDYLHIAAWGAHDAVQLPREKVLETQALASHENAPLDALFKSTGGAWTSCSEMPTNVRAEMGALVDKIAGRPS